MIFPSQTKEKALPVKLKSPIGQAEKRNDKNPKRNSKARNITFMIVGCTCVFLIAASSADLQNTLAADLRIPRTLLFRDEQIR